MAACRIGVLIPDRGDRPLFVENCERMIKQQNVKPYWHAFIDYEPESKRCDITQRYRFGYENLCRDVDVIMFMESDDWYAPDYVDVMLTEWQKAGCPELFGTNYTIYYHLKLKRYFTFRHTQRSSMMSTLIKPGLKFTWPQDHDPYTDQWLWLNNNGIKSKVVFEPSHIICVGMKHGQGMVGGDFHTGRLDRYDPIKSKGNDDNGFLQNTLDEESYKFYSGLSFFGKKD